MGGANYLRNLINGRRFFGKFSKRGRGHFNKRGRSTVNEIVTNSSDLI